ncbi:hypothetical protein ACET3Z_004597 [Daucus carota]
MAEEAVKNGDAHDGNKTVSFSAFKPQMFVEEGKVGDAVHFYKAAFGAQEVNHVTQTKRKADQELPLVVSAELKLGSTIFLVSDLSDHSSAMNKTGSNGPCFLLETDDIEGAIANAVKAGAVSEGEIDEGEGASPVGKVKDPYGMIWAITSPTIVKKMKKSEEEVQAA